MAKKKKRETPKKILDKIDEIKNAKITFSRNDNSLNINIENHEVYQYLRHRKSFNRTYDPLHSYKKALIERLEEVFNNKDINKFIKDNYENPIIFNLEVQKNPVNKTDSIKNILYKSLNEIERVYTPDNDNFQKTVFDIMNINFWKDDAQIITVNSNKKYSKDFKDRTIIKITYLKHNLEESKGRLTKEENNKYKELIEIIKNKKDELKNEK